MLEEQPAAVGVASHLFGFHIFLHSVLPVLLVALSYFFCDISDLKSGSIPHLVDGVDLATGLTRHPRVSQDKLTFLMINIGSISEKYRINIGKILDQYLKIYL